MAAFGMYHSSIVIHVFVLGNPAPRASGPANQPATMPPPPLRTKFRKFKRLIKTRLADTPWMSSMTDSHAPGNASDSNVRSGEPNPTIAAFAPSSQGDAHNQSRASVLIHQKSPLLLATPPQVTRALAYSHSFVLPLNHLAGLVSWTTGDPWESFLLVASFWFLVLYGETVLRYAGPVVLVALLTFGMYCRRYSPLSSTILTGEKKKTHKRGGSDELKQRKSLDEILDTLQTFTARCNILLDPLLQLTDFLSTQSTATSATTRPALTTLFIRILLFTPIWFLLTLPPLRILTTQRVVLAWGTLVLSWHSRPARVSRTILWRSRAVRSLTSLITGLDFPQTSLPVDSKSSSSNITTTPANNPTTTATSSPGVRFTFTLYENQRRWLGLGWTASLLAYERQAWTDEHLNETLSPDTFTLPETDHDATCWRWVEGSSWRVEGAAVENEKSAKRVGGGGGGDESGWTYYDNKWQDGRKVDGWGRYTRRRKWVRDAELVETPAAAESNTSAEIDANAAVSPRKQKGWFGGGGGSGGTSRGGRRRTMSARGPGMEGGSDAVSTSYSAKSSGSRDGPEDDVHTPVRYREREWEREIGEGLAEGLG
jgi:hypothetical protein